MVFGVRERLFMSDLQHREAVNNKKEVRNKYSAENSNFLGPQEGQQWQQGPYPQ